MGQALPVNPLIRDRCSCSSNFPQCRPLVRGNSSLRHFRGHDGQISGSHCSSVVRLLLVAGVEEEEEGRGEITRQTTERKVGSGQWRFAVDGWQVLVSGWMAGAHPWHLHFLFSCEPTHHPPLCHTATYGAWVHLPCRAFALHLHLPRTGASTASSCSCSCPPKHCGPPCSCQLPTAPALSCFFGAV